MGKELYALTGIAVLELWRSCRLLREVSVEIVGRRYLRFDRAVEGYARLSPSIQREFTTYTVVGLARDGARVLASAKELKEEIEEISRSKMEMAKGVVAEVIRRLGGFGPQVEAGACFIIGGDVPLGMAHSDPRPERSTGELVAGSDLDILVITSGLGEEAVRRLDEEIYAQKYALLRRPRKEEIDYLIKGIERVREQTRFGTFEEMVACKILHESRFLGGSEALYREVKALLEEAGIPTRLRALEDLAKAKREEAERYLLEKCTITPDEYLHLFTTSDEFSEVF